MTDRKLLEQALEALYSAPLDHNSIKSRFFERRHHAIIALRERLAQPEQEPVLQDIEQYRMQMASISTAAIGYWKEGDGIHPDYDTPALRDVAMLYAKYDALYKAQPEQKPVAWLSTDSIGERYLPTPPQKREWKRLTDEEISEINKSIPGETDLGAAKRLFAREIEAKLKEKND